jgi:heme-degrading monooxygenase HmoA
MTTIGMHYEVVPGKEEEFVQGFLKTIDHLKSVPGHVESRMFEDVTNKGSYLIMSQWQSKESFDAFIQSPEFKTLTQWGKAELLLGRPRHKVYLNQ